MLQAGRSRVRFPIKSLAFSANLILTSSLYPWESTEPLAETITTNLPWGEGDKARPGCQRHRHLYADYLENMGASTL
jgi:hypothetical protein